MNDYGRRRCLLMLRKIPNSNFSLSIKKTLFSDEEFMAIELSAKHKNAFKDLFMEIEASEASKSPE